MSNQAHQIYKYPIKTAGTSLTEVEIPGARAIKPLYAGLDPNGEPHIWVVIQKDEDMEKAYEKDYLLVHCYGTGHEIIQDEEVLEYLNSFSEGAFVWHIFIEPQDDE